MMAAWSREWGASLRQQRGYILLLTMGFLVVLILLASAIATLTERELAEQARREQMSQDALDEQSTRATVLYLLASQRMTFGGLTVDDRLRFTQDEARFAEDSEGLVTLLPVGNELRLDGSPYQGFGHLRFALQDARGLLSVNWMLPALRQGLFQQLAVPTRERQALDAKLFDYQDADALHRLEGGEAEQYLKAELAPPSNRPLRSAFELRRVLGWKTYLAAWDERRLAASLTVERSVALNVNTATPTSLLALPGMTEAAVNRILAARAVAPLISVDEFARVAGSLGVEPDAVMLYPGMAGTLLLWSEQGGPARLWHWRLTPIDDGGKPWRIEYEAAFSQPEALDAVSVRQPAAKVFSDSLPAKR